MPVYWYDRFALKKPDGDSPEELARYELCRSIVADRKPYFMRYVYPTLMKEYNSYVQSANTKCIFEFRKSIDELMEMSEDELTDRQREFLRFYRMKMPVGTHDCVMNRICRRVEAVIGEAAEDNRRGPAFDYSVMKSGVEYSKRAHDAILDLYRKHNEQLRAAEVQNANRPYEKETNTGLISAINDYFCAEAEKLCANQSQLSEILLDICYKNNKSKQFVWDAVGDSVVDGMLERNGGALRYPVLDPDGDVEYGGEKYGMIKLEVG